MIVAMIPMLMMQPAIDQIIGMVAVRHRLMTAIGAMNMAIVAFGFPAFGASLRI